jgi:hypothetical protein
MKRRHGDWLINPKPSPAGGNRLDPGQYRPRGRQNIYSLVHLAIRRSRGGLSAQGVKLDLVRDLDELLTHGLILRF